MQYKFPRFPTRCAACDRPFGAEAELVSMIFPGEAVPGLEIESGGGERIERAAEGSGQGDAGSGMAGTATARAAATTVAAGSVPGQEETLLFVRRDYCLPCTAVDESAQAQAYSVWRTRMPSPREPSHHVRIDTNVVFELFQRLAERQDPARVGYIYFLTLYLMRKRVLKFLDSSPSDEGETWIVESRPEGRRYEVKDPRLPPEALEKIRQEIMDALSVGDMEL